MFNSQLKVFVCVADCGSFTKASEKLFISATAVMKQINSLEEHLNLKLFIRSNQGIELTAAGESIYKDAKDFFDFSNKSISKAQQLVESIENTVCVGTSMLNPCKAFMDLWAQINDYFQGYKLNIVPFEDDQNGMLSLGEKYDFLIGVCDSSIWLERCNFLKLGDYKRCFAVPITHRLAKKKELDITDFYGETVVMVKRGDSPINDFERDEMEQNHPQIKIEDASNFYSIEVFNKCVQNNSLLSSVECWKDIHPSMVTIPMKNERTIPYGLIYSLTPPKEIIKIVEAIKKTIELE